MSETKVPLKFMQKEEVKKEIAEALDKFDSSEIDCYLLIADGVAKEDGTCESATKGFGSTVDMVQMTMYNLMASCKGDKAKQERMKLFIFTALMKYF